MRACTFALWKNDDVSRSRVHPAFLAARSPGGIPAHLCYGFLANRDRKQNLEQCRRLLGTPALAEPAGTAKDYRDHYEELTGHSLYQCPQCKQGRILVIEILPRPPCKIVPCIDSS